MFTLDGIIRVDKVIKPTQAYGWKNVEEGDEIHITYDVKPIRANDTRAVYFLFYNQKRNEGWTDSIAQAFNTITRCFEITSMPF